jgi:hypothetical protein
MAVDENLSLMNRVDTLPQLFDGVLYIENPTGSGAKGKPILSGGGRVDYEDHRYMRIGSVKL